HMNATINLLCKINNDIVNALGEDGDYLDAEDMSDYLPDIRAAIEHCDDVKEKFHTPYEEWKHLCDDVENGGRAQEAHQLADEAAEFAEKLRAPEAGYGSAP